MAYSNRGEQRSTSQSIAITWLTRSGKLWEASSMCKISDVKFEKLLKGSVSKTCKILQVKKY